MGSVKISVQPPDISSIKRGTPPPKTGIEYQAAFHSVSRTRKVTHFGPIVQVTVEDKDGKVVKSAVGTLQVEDKNGEIDLTLQQFVPATSPLEEEG